MSVPLGLGPSRPRLPGSRVVGCRLVDKIQVLYVGASTMDNELRPTLLGCPEDFDDQLPEKEYNERNCRIMPLCLPMDT